MDHLCFHKRLVVLGPKIEALPEDHPSKARYLQALSRLFQLVGNHVERKRLLIHALTLWRGQGDDSQVAEALSYLSDASRWMKLREEGVQQVKEPLGIFERVGDTPKRAECLIYLALLLHGDEQLEAAEEAASRAISLLPETGEPFRACNGHRILGHICQSKRETGKAIYHFGVALGIASSLNTPYDLFWVNFALAHVFFDKGRFDDAQAHIERAKSHAASDLSNLAHASRLQAVLCCAQHKFGEAKSETLCALDLFEKLGAANDAESTRQLLERIDCDARGNGTPDGSDHDDAGELPKATPLVVRINSSCSGGDIKSKWYHRHLPRFLQVWPFRK